MRTLFEPSSAIPGEVRSLVEKELALIDKHEGYSESPIFGYKEDYSQYVPRGHYTRNDQFKAFFRGMMWFGRMGFRLKPGTTAAVFPVALRGRVVNLLWGDSGSAGAARGAIFLSCRPYTLTISA